MKNLSEHDLRQLRLMYSSMISFEMGQIELSSLIGNLEFLFRALETVNVVWEELFLKEITTLETANALEIIKESGEEITEVESCKKDFLVSKSFFRLKHLIQSELNAASGCNEKQCNGDERRR